MILREPRDRDLAVDEAVLIEEMAENDAAVHRRDPVGADAIEECMSIRPLHIELGEGRKVHEAHALAHRQGFRLDSIPPIGAFERVLLA